MQVSCQAGIWDTGEKGKKNVEVLLLCHFIGALGFYVIREQLDIEKVLFKESSLCRCVCQGNEKGGG